MSSTAYFRRRLALPKDYIRRKRMTRILSNVILIATLSAVAAYVITRPTGGTAFTPPKAAKATLAPAPAAEPPPVRLPADPAANGGYKLAEGPVAVEERSDLVLHDAKRDKDLHVRVFYPVEGGQHPVIVFSHGAGGSQSCCDALTRHWASYGYITIQPTHDDSAVLRRKSGEENIRFLEAVRDALKKPDLWESRPEDISFVIDSLPVLADRIPKIANEMDIRHLGVAGHSMGSYTTEAIAGALVDLPGHPGKSFADPRVKAVLCLSPQGPGQFGLSERSFNQVSVPYMGVTGSLDSLGPVASAAWHKIPFDRSVPGDKYHLFIEGANHMSFITAQTLSLAKAGQGETILGYTNSASMAFWDAYLKGDERAKQYLGSDTLPQSSRGAVKLFRR